MIRTYTELIKIDSFVERYRYLRLGGRMGEPTFGSKRFINQVFYKDPRWQSARVKTILRDNACDLGDPDREIFEKILVHHMNPIRPQDLEDPINPDVFDPEYLITVSHDTHNAIHYGDESLLIVLPKERYKNDLCPWR